MTKRLHLNGLTRRFAGVVAVDDVSMAVRAGEIQALIGPNGAGKTSLFNLVSGNLSPSAGRILLDGADITALPPQRRAALGIGRTFQNIRIFAAMTVLENVLVGLHPALRAPLHAILRRSRGFRAEERAALARARAALAQVGLAAHAESRAGALSYGDQRRLEIARAVVAGPRLLLLDEPAAGMNPAETAGLGVLVRQLRDAGSTILLVEHDMGFVMGLADSISVLNFGRLIFHGPPAAARADAQVIAAYLGPDLAAAAP